MWSRNCLYCLYFFAALQPLSLFFAALQLKSLFRSFLKQALEQFLQLVFRQGTHLLLYRLTVLEEQQCGHRHHAIGGGYVVILLNVTLAYNDLAVLLFCKL